MRLSLFVPLVLLSTVGCGQSGLSPNDSLNGQWEWQFNANPSGSSVSLSLATVGSTVTGTGGVCGVGPTCSPGAVTITGQTAGPTFQLTIRGGSAFLATYSGQLVGSNELMGTWAEGTTSNTVIFFRK